MHFEYQPTRVRQTVQGPRFRLARLVAAGEQAGDLSHLMDLTYDYASQRELRWHLADRFGLPPSAVTLSRPVRPAAA